LQNAYQSVIDKYTATWIDFHLDASALESHEITDFRNQVLRRVQENNPNIKLSYSLPGLPTGFSDNAVYALQSAYKFGVRVDGKINFMTHYFSCKYFGL
jgi:hypothetical protein